MNTTKFLVIPFIFATILTGCHPNKKDKEDNTQSTPRVATIEMAVQTMGEDPVLEHKSGGNSGEVKQKNEATIVQDAIRSKFGKDQQRLINRTMGILALLLDNPEETTNLLKELERLVSKYAILEKEDERPLINLVCEISWANISIVRDFLSEANKSNLKASTLTNMLVHMRRCIQINKKNMGILFELTTNDKCKDTDVLIRPGDIVQYFIKIMNNCGSQDLNDAQIKAFTSIPRSTLEVLSSLPNIYKLTPEQIELFNFRKFNDSEEVVAIIVNKLILGDKFTPASMKDACLLRDTSCLVFVP
jgi:hypothetical protein